MLCYKHSMTKSLYLCFYLLALGVLLLQSDLAHASKNLQQKSVQTLPQWDDFSRRQNQSLALLRACEINAMNCTSAGIEKWNNLISSLRHENKLRQLITVNKWFNRIQYRFDEDAYNSIDYWADTKELIEQKGDCEDFALAKYYTLRQLGFDANKMKISVVYDEDSKTNHAVLMVYDDNTRYLMDINTDSMDPSPMEYRYKTIYTFNEQTAWRD